MPTRSITTESGVRPDRAFDRHVWSNPGICNNCFQRCTWVLDVDGGSEPGSDFSPGPIQHRTDHGVLAFDEVSHDEYGELRTHRPRTACADCGSIGLVNQRETRLKGEMIRLVEPLVARLEEAGVSIDVPATKQLVGRLKSRPAAQGNDREILEAAVAFGVRRARHRR